MGVHRVTSEVRMLYVVGTLLQREIVCREVTLRAYTKNVMLHSAMLCILCTKYLKGQCILYSCVIIVVCLFNVVLYVHIFPTHCIFILNVTRILF